MPRRRHESFRLYALVQLLDRVAGDGFNQSADEVAPCDPFGRKPLFLAGFLILPIRGFLYTLSDDRFWLVGVQLLDGVSAGIYGAIFPLIVADLMRGTGRFNVAQGTVITAQGIGAALSTTLAGAVVVHAGYSAAFLTLAAVAAGGLLLFLFAMPETGGDQSSSVEPDIVLRDKSAARREDAFLPSAAD